MSAATPPSQPASRGTRYDAAVERLTNLTFALQGAARSGANPDRSTEWIHQHVGGYRHLSPASLHTQLSRDVSTLARAGVHIDVSVTQQGSTYRLNPESYQLPEVSFSPQEATVLGIASEIGQHSGLGAFTTSGWTKLAASGADRRLSPSPAFVADNDITRLAPETLRAILTGVAHQLRITFDYQPYIGSATQRRRMDLWGLVPHHNRLYMVGWDVDRQAERSFRSTRISAVRRSREEATHSRPTAPLAEIVERTLEKSERVDAVIRTRANAAVPLEEVAERIDTQGSDITIYARDVDADWLVRTAAAFASQAEVIEPPQIRQRVADLCAAVLDYTADDEGK